jgi:AcrR family transcriptional regulator
MRLRHELTEEIKRVALAQLELGGPAAVSLRGIAREVGVSPAALYAYFENLEDLLTALITDGFNDLAEAVEAAIEQKGTAGVGESLLAGVLAYRRWALDHTALFRLLYFSPVPDYVAPREGPTLDANLRVCAAFLRVLVDAWNNGLLPTPEPGPAVEVQKFEDRFGLVITSDQLRESVGCWGEFHGLVSLEVGGHINNHWTDPEEMYRALMRTMLRRVGLIEEHNA